MSRTNQPGNKGESSSWEVFYHQAVVKIDIPKLGTTEAGRVKRAIESRLMVDPVLYGVPLRGTLKRYWKVRVGDFRIVYTIIGRKVLILVIAHRREVYLSANKRKGLLH